MSRSQAPRVWRLAVALLASAAASALQPASAQSIKGPTACFKCHKPNARSMWETEAPFHKNSVQQLAGPKAAGFAAAIGLPSPTTVTGRGDCVSCHATLVGGAPSVGISCESCHGPASGYLKPHEEPTFYDQPESQRLGLRDLFRNPKAIAQVCVDCHVTPDPRLKKAGHPAGEAFDAGKGIAKMVHWDSGISVNRKRSGYGPALYAQISAAAAPMVARRLASGGAAVAAAPAKKAAPPAAAPAAIRPARPAAPAAAADPFDWDQPVAELPADYPGEPAPGASAPGAAPAAPAVTAPPVAAPARPAPQVPSTAPELPLVPPAPAVAPPAPAPASAAPAAPPPASARRPATAASIAAGLLRAKGGKSLSIPRPAPPREYQGPDGELRRLEDEILYLALEALRRDEP